MSKSKELGSGVVKKQPTVNILCLDYESKDISLSAQIIKKFVDNIHIVKKTKDFIEYIKDGTLSKEFNSVLIFQSEGENDAFYHMLIKKIADINKDYEIIFAYRNVSDRVKSLLSIDNINLIPATPIESLELTFPLVISKIKYKQRFYKVLIQAKELKEKMVNIGNTYRKENKELELKLQMKEAWFSSMVHELRTPVNGVIGITHLMEKTELDDKQKDYVRKIKNSGELLLGVVNDLLDFSKLESGKLDLEYIEFDLNEVLDKVATVIGVKAKDKKLELIFDISKEVPAKIKGDPLRLSQVLINLLGNAVKFTDEGEVILRISMKMKDERDKKGILLFEVIDTGIGISPERQNKLFQRFSQIDASISRKYGGSGLGLMISKQLVELMGGEINVKSTPGKGSNFYFTMPTERIDRRNYRLPSKDLMKKRVLIINENINSARALAKMLGYFHYITKLATDRESLKRELSNGKFDIIFIDDSLAKDVYTDVIKDSKGAVLVNLYSEYSDEAVLKECKGFKLRVSKPLTQKKIFDLIVQIYTTEDKKENETKKEKILDQISGLDGIKIIVADDNSINQAVIMGLLENAKIDIYLANNGDEVLDILSKENDIDMVLMDLNMPVMNGIEATKYIRANERYAHLPVIALSADLVNEDKLREYQMQAFIAKPIDFNKFYEVIIKVLSNKKHEAVTNSEYYMAQHGFNVKKGIKRAGGNHHLYCKMVENFIKTAKDSADTLLNKLLWGDFENALREADIILAASDNVQAKGIYKIALRLRESLLTKSLELSKEIYHELRDTLELLGEEMEKALIFERIYNKKADRFPRGGKSIFREKMDKLYNAASERRPFHCAKLLEELDRYWWDVEREKVIKDLMEMSKEYRFNDMENYIRENKKIIDD